MSRCPICGREFQAEQGSAMPFCSPRCRMIDLGRWLDEKYGLPIDSESKEEVLSDDVPPKKPA